MKYLLSVTELAENYVRARAAVIAAKKAWHDYLDAQWGPVDRHLDPNDPPRRHSFGHCRVPLDAHGTEAPLCEICAGSEPIYALYRQAVAKRQGALRSLQRRVLV